MSIRLIGLPPSITLATTMKTSAPMTPIRVAGSISPPLRRVASPRRAVGCSETVPRWVGARAGCAPTMSRSIAVLMASTSPRWRRTDVRTSSRDSRTTYFLPSTSVTTVSGVASTRSIRSQLRANFVPESRVSVIMCTVLGPCRERLPWRLEMFIGGRRVRPEGCAATNHARAPGFGTRAGAGAGSCWMRRSALDVDELLEDLVGGGDDARAGLEAALGEDQVGELAGQVDVRHLDRAGDDLAAAALAGDAEAGGAGVGGRRGSWCRRPSRGPSGS